MMNWTPQPDTAVPVSTQIERLKEIASQDHEFLEYYEAALVNLDVIKNQSIIDKYGSHVGFDGPLKQLDTAYWIFNKLKVAFSLDLHKSKGMDVLDLGTGAGHFLHVCRILGHRAVGLDVGIPLLREISDLMGVSCIEHRISRRDPLPSFGTRFDLITAFAAQFDVMPGPAYWDVADWRWFLRDLIENQLKRPGR